MPLDKETVARVARLARIHVDEDQLEPLSGELNNILGWIEQLREVDTDRAAPMTSVADMTLAMREDKVTDGGAPERVLANAPARADDFYVVQKVVE